MVPPLKDLILGLVPPMVVKMIRKTKFFVIGIRHGTLSDYQNLELINSVISKHKEFQKTFSKNKEIDISNFRTLYGLLLAANKNKLTIVDFGGGPGTHYTIAKKIFPDIHFEWNIIETPKFVEEARKQSNSEINYFSDLNSIKSPIDIMFTSSALQYTPDPFKTLSTIVEKKAKYLIITRTPFSKQSKITDIQKSLLSENGPGEPLKQITNKIVSYKITIENIDLIEQIINQEYSIKLKIIEEEKVHKLKGIYIDYYGYFCELK
jgi:putative methyltransferase (TIGR04325 family)